MFEDPEFSILLLGDTDNSEHIENGLNYLLDEYGVFKYVTYYLSKECPDIFNVTIKNLLDNMNMIYTYIDGLYKKDNKIYVKNLDVEIDNYFTNVTYFSELKRTTMIDNLQKHYERVNKKFELYIC